MRRNIDVAARLQHAEALPWEVSGHFFALLAKWDDCPPLLRGYCLLQGLLRTTTMPHCVRIEFDIEGFFASMGRPEPDFFTALQLCGLGEQLLEHERIWERCRQTQSCFCWGNIYSVLAAAL